MRYYFSSPFEGYIPEILSDLIRTGVVKNLLASYAMYQKMPDKYDYTNVNWMIDSGAFSVWRKGKHIDLDNYIDFCFHLENTVPCKSKVYISLDQIPGIYGKGRPTVKQVKEACKVSITNFHKCMDTGLKFMPVYHQFEPVEILKEYCQMTDYVGLSPDNTQPEKSKRKYLAGCFKHTGAEIKTHGFGYSSMKGMELFPFYSCDSISYKIGEIYGRVIGYSNQRFVGGNNETFGSRIDNDDIREFFNDTTHRIDRPINRLNWVNVVKYTKWQDRITELWEKRGVTWDE